MALAYIIKCEWELVGEDHILDSYHLNKKSVKFLEKAFVELGYTKKHITLKRDDCCISEKARSSFDRIGELLSADENNICIVKHFDTFNQFVTHIDIGYEFFPKIAIHSQEDILGQLNRSIEVRTPPSRFVLKAEGVLV